MNYPRRPSARHWLTSASAAFVTFAVNDHLVAAPWPVPADLPLSPPDRRGAFGFSYDAVLGTSLDVQLDAPSPHAARECERAMLAEIDRLEAILSTYRPASEINRVKAGAPVESPELQEVLAAYDLWSVRTGRALHGNLADVIALWKQAAKSGGLPSEVALAEAFAVPSALNVDALGKGYIVDRTVTVARQFAASGMLNIGGDIRVWGEKTWMVGVADPRNAADNAAPVLQFPLREAAVATSAGYARSFLIDGRRYSHLIDPRTLRPIDAGANATIVAGDCLTANALSTAAAVLGSSAGSNLARTYALDHLIVDGPPQNGVGGGSGSTVSSAHTFNPLATASTTHTSAHGAWPAGFQVEVNVALKSPDGLRFKRPYVAVWIEDHDQKVVRTLAIWGTQGRYLPELTKWWRATGGDHSVIQAVSRATRQPGTYTLNWDGLDQRGEPLPAGEYKIWVEINREHGHHIYESASLTCGTEPATVELRATAESDAARIAYGPTGK